MPLAPGVKFGPYEIVAPLGAGGMGEVYRARDERLHRDVAVKVLPADGHQSAARVERFGREARAAAAVRHPNILTIYDVGTGSEPFIVYELLEGDTLRDALRPGSPWPGEKVVDVARQIAEGLAAAHARGVVHRDLKPENIFLGRDGVVKILDFGLARLTEAVVEQTDATGPLTEEGTVLGTMGYMAPEQLRGLPADHRSDIFAFGAVLYELLTTRRAFKGDSVADTISAILTTDPPELPRLRSTVSPALTTILTRCLEKQPENRFQSAGDLAFALKEARNGAVGRPASVRAPLVSRRRVLWTAGTLAAAAAGGSALLRFWPGPAGIRSLAVLPFVNSSGDEDSEFLCDGLTESVIHRIGRLPAPRVMARSTVFNFRGVKTDPRETGARLGVDAVLTGTLVRRQGRLLVSVDLIDVKTGVELWGNRFDREADDVLAVEEELASQIVEQGIGVRLTEDERRDLTSQPTGSKVAYELYLRGMHLQRRDTFDDLLRARSLFEQALEKDQGFALAHAGLASSHGIAAVAGFERPIDTWPIGESHARRALALDPRSAEAHNNLSSNAFFFGWRWNDAERELKIATQLTGNEPDPDLLHVFALQRWALGRVDEAVSLSRQARQADSISPEFTIALADYLLQAEQLDESAQLYAQVVKDNPEDAWAYFGLAEVRSAQHRFDEAFDARMRAHRAMGDDALVDRFKDAHGESGYVRLEQAAVRQELERLEARASGAYVSPLDFARAHAQLGEADQAFKYFEPAFAERASGLPLLKVDRAWTRVRADARFAAALKRVGLA